MSQYMSFFIKHNAEFIPIGSYSCSHPLCNVAHYGIPYEHVTPITKDRISDWLEFAEVEKKSHEDIIEERNHTVNILMNASNPLEEKIDYINEVEDLNREDKEEIELIIDAMHYFKFLIDIIDEAEAKAIVDNNLINLAKYIYAGIEINSPTIKDIEQKEA